MEIDMNKNGNTTGPKNGHPGKPDTAGTVAVPPKGRGGWPSTVQDAKSGKRRDNNPPAIK